MLSRGFSIALAGQTKFMLGYLKPIEEHFVCHINVPITKISLCASRIIFSREEFIIKIANNVLS